MNASGAVWGDAARMLASFRELRSAGIRVPEIEFAGLDGDG
jgi:hypothetical protein